MSLICVNCGLANEDDSRFCSRCGFQLPVVEQSSYVEYSPPSPPESKPVVFVSSSPSPSYRSRSRRCARSPRHQRSGWVLGFFFLAFGLLLAIFLLVPLMFNLSYNHYFDMSDFGATMGDFGETMGDLGGRFGEMMGSFGSRLGDFFGNLGDSIGDSVSMTFSGHSFRRVIFFLIPGLFFLFGAVMLLVALRNNRRSV